MDHPGFFNNEGPFSLTELGEHIDAEIKVINGDRDLMISDVKSLDEAGAGHLGFFENSKYLSQFESTKASACIVSQKYADHETSADVLLVVPDAYRAYARILDLFYPSASRPSVCGDLTGGNLTGQDNDPVHASAVLEEDVVIEPGAVIGAQVHIGRGTRICAGAVIGTHTHIGRDCHIGPNANLVCALVGDNVIVHQGVSIGQDGFGFAMGPQGHLKVPQIGRVILQDHVEIGANTTIDRGALKDTIIGEGTKIDNLVQIGHNVVTGRHCVIVAQVGISGSTELGDFVVFGGQAACVGHITIGTGAKIAANGKVSKDVEPGAVLGGAPAMPILQWKRELIALRRLAKKGK